MGHLRCHRRQKGDGGSGSQKPRAEPLPDIVRDRKHSSTPIASDTTVITADWEPTDFDLWIPKQIVSIGEDFHSQDFVITNLTTMVKVFKESHTKDVEKLTADSLREAEKNW